MSDDPHTIRLHGPWQATVIRNDANSASAVEKLLATSPTRLQIPSDWSDWLGVDFRGAVKFERAFGLPTGLESEQEIWLVITEVDYRAKVWINDTFMGELQLYAAPLRVAVRHLLQARNRLRIHVELPIESKRGERTLLAGGLIGEVRLEIAPT